MKKLINHSILSIALTLILVTSCAKPQDPFAISKHNIGLLNDSTQVKDLETVFSNDSIVKHVTGDEFTGNINDIQVFDKTGKELLVLSPSQAFDSTATVKTVRIVDERFKTNKGLHCNSSFKHIKDNYKISNIQSSLRNVIVSINEINAYVTIDKNELPSELRFDMNAKIEAIHIPDEAEIKDLFLQWY